MESLAPESTLAIRHLECDIEVTIAITTTMSLITYLDTHAIFDSFWDIDIFLDGLMELSFSVTVLALFDDLLARSMTDMTRSLLLHNSKYSLDSLTYLPTPMTRRTCLGSSTSTITVMAVNFSVERYLATRATDSILERYLHRYLNISSYICPSSPSTSTTKSSTKKL